MDEYSCLECRCFDVCEIAQLGLQIWELMQRELTEPEDARERRKRRILTVVCQSCPYFVAPVEGELT